MTKKRFLTAILITAMLAAFIPVSASAANRVVNVILNGGSVDFVDTNAQIINNYTYVPIARIIEILTGQPPDWNANTRMASFSYNGHSYNIYSSQSGIYIDGVFSAFDAPPLIVNNRTLIPLRMLSEALGFTTVWDNATSTVTLTSPQPVPTPQSLPLIVSVAPQSVTVNPGESVTAVVAASVNTTEVKIVDAHNNIMVSSKFYILSGANKQFTMAFAPTATGSYRALAADSSGYNVNSYQSINVTLGAAASVNSISLSNSTVTLDSTVTAIVYTSNTATRVRLVSDYNSNDIVESTSYSENGNERVFRLSWPIRSGYYSGRSSVSAKVYAGTASGYTSNYRTTSVYIGTTATIYDAYPDESSIDAGHSTNLYVRTDASVASVNFSISSGDGSLDQTRLTSFTTSGATRIWQTRYYAGNTAGTTRIAVTAQSPGGSANGVINVNVYAPVPSDGNIYSVGDNTGGMSLDAGESVTISITTGTGVTELRVSQDFMSGVAGATLATNNGSRKTWVYSYTIPNNINLADGIYGFYIDAYSGKTRTDYASTSIHFARRITVLPVSLD